jgi:hypothetical protein
MLEVDFSTTLRSDHTEVLPTWRTNLEYLFMRRPDLKTSRTNLQQVDSDMVAALQTAPDAFLLAKDTRVLRPHDESWLNAYDP